MGFLGKCGACAAAQRQNLLVAWGRRYGHPRLNGAPDGRLWLVKHTDSGWTEFPTAYTVKVSRRRQLDAIDYRTGLHSTSDVLETIAHTYSEHAAPPTAPASSWCLKENDPPGSGSYGVTLSAGYISDTLHRTVVRFDGINPHWDTGVPEIIEGYFGTHTFDVTLSDPNDYGTFLGRLDALAAGPWRDDAAGLSGVTWDSPFHFDPAHSSYWQAFWDPWTGEPKIATMNGEKFYPADATVSPLDGDEATPKSNLWIGWQAPYSITDLCSVVRGQASFDSASTVALNEAGPHPPDAMPGPGGDGIQVPFCDLAEDDGGAYWDTSGEVQSADFASAGLPTLGRCANSLGTVYQLRRPDFDPTKRQRFYHFRRA